MGTRSLTIIQDNGKDLATIYLHWDGYPEAHGQDLKNWFADREIVNKYTSGQDRSKVINGIGCLAALVCAKLFENGHDPRVLLPETREVGEALRETLRDRDELEDGNQRADEPEEAKGTESAPH